MDIIGQTGAWWTRAVGTVALTTAIFGAAHAADISFNVASGDWDAATNWVGNVLPGAVDTAVLAPTQDFIPIATKTGGTIASNIRLVGSSKLQLAGNVTLTGDLIDGGAFGSEIRMASGANVGIDSGTLISGRVAFLGNLFASAGSNPRTITNRGTIRLSLTSFLQPNVLNNELGGVIEAINTADMTVLVDALNNAGTLRVQGLGSRMTITPNVVTPVTFTSSGIVQVSDNATLNLERPGAVNASDYVFRNTGQFDATADATVRVSGATLTGTGALNFDDATLLLDNRGLVSNTTVNLANDSRLRFAAATGSVQNSTINGNRFTLTVDGGVSATATGNTIRNANGTALTIVRGGTGTLNLAGSTLTATGAGSIFTLQDAGQVNLTGNSSITAGTVTLNNGDLGLQDTARITGATPINATNGSALSINGAGVNLGAGTLNASTNSLVSLTNHTFTNNRVYNFNASTLALNTGGGVNGATLNLNNGATARFDTTGANITGATLTGDRFTVSASTGNTGTIQNSSLLTTANAAANVITFAGPGSLVLSGTTTATAGGFAFSGANVTLTGMATLSRANATGGGFVMTNATLTLAGQNRITNAGVNNSDATMNGSTIRFAGNQFTVPQGTGSLNLSSTAATASNLLLSGATAGGTTLDGNIALIGRWNQIGASYDGGANPRNLVMRGGGLTANVSSNTAVLTPTSLVLDAGASIRVGNLFTSGVTNSTVRIVPTGGVFDIRRGTLNAVGTTNRLIIGDAGGVRTTMNTRPASGTVEIEEGAFFRVANADVTNERRFHFDHGGAEFDNVVFNNVGTTADTSRFVSANGSEIVAFNTTFRGGAPYLLGNTFLSLDTSTVDGATLQMTGGNVLVTGSNTVTRTSEIRNGSVTGAGITIVNPGHILKINGNSGTATFGANSVTLDLSQLTISASGGAFGGAPGTATVTAGSVLADTGTILMQSSSQSPAALRSGNIRLRSGSLIKLEGTGNSIGATTGNTTVTFDGTVASDIILSTGSGTAQLNIPSTMTMTGRIGRIGGAATSQFGLVRVLNAGRITSNVSGNRTTIDPQSFSNSGVLEAVSGARMDINTDTRPSNSGGITVGDGSTLTLFDGLIQTAGTTSIASGRRLVVGAGQTFELRGGALNGTGRVTGSVVNTGGTTSPGNSPGMLEIAGDYTQSGDGIFHVELGGDNPTLFDQLQVFGNVKLGGTLLVTALDGYVPSMGQSFECIFAETITGRFDQIVSYVPGFHFRGSIVGNTWSMATVASVPETGSIWLILGGFGVGGVALWRKHSTQV